MDIPFKFEKWLKNILWLKRLKRKLSAIGLQPLTNETVGVAGFPLLAMYFSRHLVSAFKSRDLFDCACDGERRQTL